MLNGKRLALTKKAGFIRACTNQRQRSQMDVSLTKVKGREATDMAGVASLTKGREASLVDLSHVFKTFGIPLIVNC